MGAKYSKISGPWTAGLGSGGSGGPNVPPLRWRSLLIPREGGRDPPNPALPFQSQLPMSWPAEAWTTWRKRFRPFNTLQKR